MGFRPEVKEHRKANEHAKASTIDCYSRNKKGALFGLKGL